MSKKVREALNLLGLKGFLRTKMQYVFDGQKSGKPSNYRAFGVLSKNFLSAARACKPLKTLRFS